MKVTPLVSNPSVRRKDVEPTHIAVAPLLAVEVLSPKTRRKDLWLQRDLYAEHGVASFWAVDPDEPSLRAWDLAEAYGFSHKCREVLACEVPVLDLDGVAEQKVAELAKEALTHEGVDSIVLGCAGMAEMAAAVTEEVGAPVIDGVSAAVGLVEAMVRARVPAASQHEWAAPRPKVYVGLLEGFTIPERG